MAWLGELFSEVPFNDFNTLHIFQSLTAIEYAMPDLSFDIINLRKLAWIRSPRFVIFISILIFLLKVIIDWSYQLRGRIASLQTSSHSFLLLEAFFRNLLLFLVASRSTGVTQEISSFTSFSLSKCLVGNCLLKFH